MRATTQARLETTGHMFEKRYYPALVDVEAYFMELLRYIHLNPVRAGLASDADGYLWSSHHVYTGARREDWVTTDFGLAFFGPDSPRAIRAYRQFLDASRGRPMHAIAF